MKNVQEQSKRKPISLGEVREAFQPLAEKYPPILNLELAAELSGYTRLTLKKKLSEGCFAGCVSRGKPLLFWRDRFVVELMNRAWTPPAPLASDDDDATSGGCNGGGHEAD